MALTKEQLREFHRAAVEAGYLDIVDYIKMYGLEKNETKRNNLIPFTKTFTGRTESGKDFNTSGGRLIAGNFLDKDSSI